MGVTLERVQNKFACIIGELCNEPYVLSQFAIWVDLRIAEYKANGAIQLDCTGSAPEPTWLKGMKPPVTLQSDPLSLHGSPGSANRNGRQRHQGFGSSQTWSPSEISHNPTSDTRLDDDFEIVEVKEEPQDFPSSLFTSNRSNRKRNSMDQNQDFLKSDNVIFPTQSTKVRRLSSASESTFNTAAHDPVTHQSFMSVIGISDHPSTSADNTSNIQTQDSSISEYQKGNVSAEYGYDNRLNAPSSVSTDSGIRANPMTSTIVFPSVSPSKSLLQSLSRPISSPRGPGRPPMTVMAENTVSNTWSAVSIFERWMIQHYNGVMRQYRNLEKIPVAQLDNCLTIFWPSIKKHDGTDYRAQSLVQLRTRLERHLRSHGYPESIVKSRSFQSSQKAFKERTSGPVGVSESPAFFYQEYRSPEASVNFPTDLSLNVSENMVSGSLGETLSGKGTRDNPATDNTTTDNTAVDNPVKEETDIDETEKESTGTSSRTARKDSTPDSP